MIPESVFIILFLTGAVLDFLLNHLLEYIDFFQRKRHGKELPSELKDFVDSDNLEKTCSYEDEKYFLWIPSSISGLALRLALVFSGFYVFIYSSFYSLTHNVYATVILFALLSGIPDLLLSVPFSLYKEFRIEKKFGFSNMTPGMWLSDCIKSAVISAVIMIPLLSAAVCLIMNFNDIWWLIFGAIYLLFSAAVSYIYPVWIAPLFNKFTPLPDGELKERINKLFLRTGFKTSGIFTMDASRRSAHSNAYFTGFGKNKRIVLYDTLLTQLEPEEIEAVLCHELGHCKRHHIMKRMCAGIPLVFISLFLLSRLVCVRTLYDAFGADADGSLTWIQPLGIFFTGLIVEGWGFIFSFISNFFSRRDEFQADAYSKMMCGGKPLISALIKLNRENLSELVPPKIYSMFNYSHPPLMERIRALED